MPAPLRWYVDGDVALQLAFLDPYTASYAYNCNLRRGYRGPMYYRVELTGPVPDWDYRADMESVCLDGLRPPSYTEPDLIRSGYLLGATPSGSFVGLHYHGDVGRWFPIRLNRRAGLPPPSTSEVVGIARRALAAGLAAFRSSCLELEARWRRLWEEMGVGVTQTTLTAAQLDLLAGSSAWRTGFTAPTSPYDPGRQPPRIDWPVLYDEYWRRQVSCRLFEPEVRADPEAVRKLHELTGIPEEEIAHTARNYALLQEQLRESLAAVGVEVPEGW